MGGIIDTALLEDLGETLEETFGTTLEATLGETLDANFGQKKIFKKFVFGDSNPGQIDDFHSMILFSLSIYIRKISNLTTEIQRLKKKT